MITNATRGNRRGAPVSWYVLTALIIACAVLLVTACASSRYVAPAPSYEADACGHAFAFVLAVRNEVYAQQDARAMADLMDSWHREAC